MKVKFLLERKINLSNNFYKEEPKPEYAPYTNVLRTAKTPNPPTNATNQRGILPVLAILSQLNFIYKNP